MANGKASNGKALDRFFDRPEPAPSVETKPPNWYGLASYVIQAATAGLLATCLMVTGIVTIPAIFQLCSKIDRMERELESKYRDVAEQELLLGESRKQTVIQQATNVAAAETARRLNEENIRLAKELQKALKEKNED